MLCLKKNNAAGIGTRRAFLLRKNIKKIPVCLLTLYTHRCIINTTGKGKPSYIERRRKPTRKGVSEWMKAK